MRRCVAGTAILALAVQWLPAQVPPLPFMQTQAVILASQDIQTVGAAYRNQILYVWVEPNFPDAKLDRLHRVLSGMVNGMSREPDLTPLVVVPGARGRLLRLSLRDYRWKRSVVSQWAKVDSYFYTTVDEYWPGGQGYEKGNYKVEAVAPWAVEGPEGQAAGKYLLVSTGGKTPMVSATLFAFTTFVSTNGSPAYNDFLGVRTELDFFKLIGVREDEDEAFSKNLLAVIADSGITYEPRAIEMREKIGGLLWRTHDFAKATDGSNPFERLGSDAKTKKLRAKADAHEDYGHLANGLWAVGLFNGGGVAQNNAPDTITTGDSSTSDPRDHRVHLPLSCLRCHSQGGSQPLDDWVRNLQSPPPVPTLNLQVGNRANPQDVESAISEALRFRRQYGIKLEPFLVAGRARYESSLLEVTGMKSGDYATAVGEVWHELCEPRIYSDYAARSMGMTEQEFVARIDRQVKVTGGVNPILSGFLKPRPNQKPLQLRQWLSVYGEAQKVVRGLVDVQKVKP